MKRGMCAGGMKAVVMSDMDGTLLHGKRAEQSTIDLLNQKPEGYLICYSTGSRLDSVLGKLARTGLPAPDVLSVENGSKLFYFSNGTLEEDKEWSLYILGKHGEHRERLREWADSLPQEIRVHLGWKEVIGIIPQEKLPYGGLDTIISAKDGCAKITVNLGTVELAPITAGKDVVAQYMKQQLPDSTIVAMGDGQNDVLMLKVADYGMTFHDAHVEALEAVASRLPQRTGYITEFSAHEGTADLLRTAYLIK